MARLKFRDPRAAPVRKVVDFALRLRAGFSGVKMLEYVISRKRLRSF